MINKSIKYGVLVTCLSLMVGCQGTGTLVDISPRAVAAKKKDALRTKWSCDVQKGSDYRVNYQENDFYGSLTVPLISPGIVKRLRTDFELPQNIEDIVSIKFVAGQGEPTRLMKGYIPTKVCGEFFARNTQLSESALSIFTDIHSKTGDQQMVWQIIYVDVDGEIFTTRKALAFAQR